MHEEVGKHQFVIRSLKHATEQLNAGSPLVSDALRQALGSTDAAVIENKRIDLAKHLDKTTEAAMSEMSHGDLHYVSRFDAVGIFQSILFHVFCDIPDLQGYGDCNPLWAITAAEETIYETTTFLQRVYEDVHGNKKPLLHSIIVELAQFKYAKAPYPTGIPAIRTIPSNTSIVLLADWGGDNDAARNIANVVKKHNPSMGIHLGDIYYGGTRQECESFLRLWPFHVDSDNHNSSIRDGSSLALNGNHEMYSGGEAYFHTILPAFGQAQPFFCLENEYWRIIGLDTAYSGGHLKPSGPDDPLNSQWNWLIDLLKNGPKRTNILLTHHQPVSAHEAEWNDSALLRSEIEELLTVEGIDRHVLFGWFFGHEHRCALYNDSNLYYNARLIGNGCIPHQVQHEKASDLGCTPVKFFNKQETSPGSGAAVSSFAELTFTGPELLINYCNEDNGTWGTELWDATKGRFGGGKFKEYDGLQQ